VRYDNRKREWIGIKVLHISPAAQINWLVRVLMSGILLAKAMTIKNK
jgi:hypothetical protein